MNIYCNCPIHGIIPEELQMNSAGGKFCGVTIEETDETCMEPLELKPLQLNADANISQ
jgi:hypothetical protein